MMINIFEYIDRVFSIVRPRKVLYMAIDGVVRYRQVKSFSISLCFKCILSLYKKAPRAKMNQQRSRRFQSAKEEAQKVQEISVIRQQLVARGKNVPPQRAEHFDSNCITPVI